MYRKALVSNDFNDAFSKMLIRTFFLNRDRSDDAIGLTQTMLVLVSKQASAPNPGVFTNFGFGNENRSNSLVSVSAYHWQKYTRQHHGTFLP